MPELKIAVVPVTPFQQNASIVWDETSKRGAVIDPGGDLPRILEALDELEVNVEKIVLTHGHIDHAGGAAELAEALRVPIEGPHEADRFWIARLEDDGRAYNITGKVFESDRWLVNGDTVTVGELTFDVYHCPGHTPGHVVFHHPESKLAIVGDVLFQGSIGRTDFPRGNHQDLIDAIRSAWLPRGKSVRPIEP